MVSCTSDLSILSCRLSDKVRELTLSVVRAWFVFSCRLKAKRLKKTRCLGSSGLTHAFLQAKCWVRELSGSVVHAILQARCSVRELTGSVVHAILQAECWSKTHCPLDSVQSMRTFNCLVLWMWHLYIAVTVCRVKFVFPYRWVRPLTRASALPLCWTSFKDSAMSVITLGL